MIRATIPRGDGPRRIHIRDTVDTAGDPFNFDGWTIRFTAKRQVSDTDEEAVIAKSSANAGHVEVLGLGEADIIIVAADTASLDDPWDVELVCDVQVGRDNQVHTLDKGTLTVEADVTRTAP